MSFTTFLTGFENVLWYISLGLLISGGILVLLSFIFNIESLTHSFGTSHDISIDHDVLSEPEFHDLSLSHDFSVDHDVSVDHDFSVDHDVSVDHDFSVDHDVSVDHDFSVDHDVSTDHDISADHDHDVTAKGNITHVELESLKDVTQSSAPIFLLLSTYFLIFGILGLSTLRVISDSIGLRIFRILIVIVSPFIIAWGITALWKRISSTKVEPIKRGNELIGMEGIVYIPVDAKGGVIHVDLGEGQGVQKLPAKSYNYYDRFERDERVRIVAIKDNTYLIDVE